MGDTILWIALGRVVVFPSAQAQDQEAANLFRNMEKRILAANSMEVRFDYQIENSNDKKCDWKTKGNLLLTNENRAQVKVSGYFADVRDAKFQLVSNGKQLKTLGAKHEFCAVNFLI